MCRCESRFILHTLKFMYLYFFLHADPGDVCCRFGEARGHAIQIAARSKDGSGRVDSFVDTLGILSPPIPPPSLFSSVQAQLVASDLVERWRSFLHQCTATRVLFRALVRSDSKFEKYPIYLTHCATSETSAFHQPGASPSRCSHYSLESKVSFLIFDLTLLEFGTVGAT